MQVVVAENRAPRQRLWLLAGVLIAIGVVAVSRGLQASQTGPLTQKGSTNTGLPIQPGTNYTFGFYLPTNPTTVPITIDEVDVVGAQGLDILGFLACLPDTPNVGVGTAEGFPPKFPRGPVCPLTPLAGLAVPPLGDPSPDRQILVGFRLPPGRTGGSFDGLRIRYHSDAGSYEAVLPDALHVTLAAASAQP